MAASDPVPRLDDVRRAVAARYAALASACDLSCGDALDLADPRPGEVLVDLGCGRGRDVVRAASRVGPTGRAIGIDASDAMLEAARASVPQALRNIRFVKSDLAALDLPASLADVVVSNCAINHAPDKAAVYREIRRILRPGGRLVVSDVIAEAQLPESVRSDPAAWAACYGGAVTEREYLAAIASAGFRDAQVLQRTDPYDKGGALVRSLTVRARRQTVRSAPQPRSDLLMKMLTRPKKSCCGESAAQCCAKSSRLVSGCHD